GVDPAGRLHSVREFERCDPHRHPSHSYSDRAGYGESLDHGVRHDALTDGLSHLQLEEDPRASRIYGAGGGVECGERDGCAIVLERRLYAAGFQQSAAGVFNTDEAPGDGWRSRSGYGV